MLDGNQAQMSEVVQTEQTSDSEGSADYKQLYLDEVNNSKKLRKRAQSSETLNQDYLKNQEVSKLKGMKDQEKYKELSETLQSKLDQVTPYKDKWDTFEIKKKDSLLAKLPEADRERMSTKDIDTLEYIVSKIDEVRPSNPVPSPGVSRGIDTKNLDNWMNMSAEDKRKHWDSIKSKYTKK
jgi:hypothetical protein